MSLDRRPRETRYEPQPFPETRDGFVVIAALSNRLRGTLHALLTKKLLESYVPEFFTVAFTFSLMVVINRVWGVETFGAWALTLSITALVSSVCGAKTEDSVMRLYRKAVDAGTPEQSSALVVLGLGLDIATFALATLVCLALWSLVLAPLLPSADPTIFALILSAYFIGLMRGSFVGVLIAEQRVGFANGARTLDAGLKVVGIAVMAPLAPESPLIVIAGAYLLAAVVTFFYALAAMLLTQALPRPQFSRSLVNAFGKLNLVTYLSATSKIGGQRLDTVIVAQFVSIEILGLYEVLKRVVTPVQYLHMPLVPLYSKPMVSNFDSGAAERNASLIHKSVMALTGLLSVYFLVLFVLLPWIIKVQNIVFQPEIYIGVAILAGLAWLNAVTWWLRLFTLLNRPSMLVWTSLLYTAGVLCLPWLLFSTLSSPPLVIGSLAYALPILPGLIVRYMAYRAYMKTHRETNGVRARAENNRSA